MVHIFGGIKVKRALAILCNATALKGELEPYIEANLIIHAYHMYSCIIPGNKYAHVGLKSASL